MFLCVFSLREFLKELEKCCAKIGKSGKINEEGRGRELPIYVN
jgi:hypothetical protein